MIGFQCNGVVTCFGIQYRGSRSMRGFWEWGLLTQLRAGIEGQISYGPVTNILDSCPVNIFCDFLEVRHPFLSLLSHPHLQIPALNGIYGIYLCIHIGNLLMWDWGRYHVTHEFDLFLI